MMETGYNNAWCFNQFPSNNYYVPLSIIDKIKTLPYSPMVIRWPGGTLANYYTYKDINGNELPGYGTSAIGEQTKCTQNYLSRHVDLITRLRAKTSYVCNVYQALLNPTEENIQYRIKESLEVISLIPNCAYVELGNEINISGEYMQVADKPTFWETLNGSYVKKVNQKAIDYCNIANKFYDAIKTKYPNVLIGVPMGNPFTVRNKEWNRVLRLNAKFDFEIFHIYLLTNSTSSTKTEIEKTITGAIKPVAITEFGPQLGPDCSKNLSYLTTPYSKQLIPDMINTFRSKNVLYTCQHMLINSNSCGIIKPT